MSSIETIPIMLMTKLMSGTLITLYEMMIYIVVMPLITIFIKNFDWRKIREYYETYFVNEKTFVLTGFETMKGQLVYHTCPDEFYAMNNILINNYNAKRTVLCHVAGNSKQVVGTCPKIHTPNFSYSVSRTKNDVGDKKDITSSITTTMMLYSNKINLGDFVEQTKIAYLKSLENKTKNNIYHFIFKSDGGDDGLCFSKQLLSSKKDSLDEENKLNETFEHLFHDHVDTFKNDIKQLRDKKYYAERGLKRKKGYIFHGEPGNGKSSTVMAMALEDNRHIIEIPFSRVKTGETLENILNLTKIQGIQFTNEEVIMFFDEIDVNSNSLNKRKQEKDNIEDNITDIESKLKESQYKINLMDTIYAKDKKKFADMIKLIDDTHKESKSLDKLKNTIKNDDEINLGIMLSRMDGIGNYNGIIFIAATNYLNNLDPSLYREMRLTPYKFDYATQNNIIQMIEKYCNQKVLHLDKLKIPDICNKISFAKVRHIICCCNENYDKIIDRLSQHINCFL